MHLVGVRAGVGQGRRPPPIRRAHNIPRLPTACRPRCVCAPAPLRGITPAIASPIDFDRHDLNGEPLGQNGPHGYLLRRIRSADVVANGIQAPSLAAKNRHHTGATRRVCCTRATSRVVTPICQSSAKPSLSSSEIRLQIISPLNLSKKTFPNARANLLPTHFAELPNSGNKH